tara:strand:+ start:3342 stop:3914 length:573 start_codon:yes stop_codon:yes gene_type:complete
MKAVPISTKQVVLAFLFMVAFIGVFIISGSLSQNEQVALAVQEFGYVGVVIVSVIAGLNIVVPIPAATFTPIFTAAGLAIPLVIAALTVGTLIADFTGYLLGNISRGMVEKKHPKIQAFFINLKENRGRLVVPVVLLYAAFAPFPNEALLIPLGLAGVRFTAIVIPLIVGNLINQTYLVYFMMTASDYIL